MKSEKQDGRFIIMSSRNFSATAEPQKDASYPLEMLHTVEGKKRTPGIRES